MKIEKIDRRVKYTKMLLKQSLVDLMRDNPISKVSVKMLCEAADINRSTFYAHYSDQYDLLKQIEQEVIAEFGKNITKHSFHKHNPETVQGLNEILIYIAKNAELFKVLLSENGDSNFQRELMLLAQQKTISELRNDQSIDARTSEYLQSFVVTGALNVVQKWLQDGMSESTEKMAEITSKLLYNGLSGFYS
jgi:AcrR family transcriptional regulator